jgi:hypothetical protein
MTPGNETKLHRLRDEIYNCYCGSRSVYRHALHIRTGEPESAEETRKWREGFGAFLGNTQFRFANEGSRHASGQSIADCHYGYRLNGTSEMARFWQQVERATSPALDHLYQLGIDYGPLRARYPDWFFLCYLFTWDYHEYMTFHVRQWVYYDDKKRFPEIPFRDRASFEAWEKGESKIPDGNYFLAPSTDIRICTVEIIDAILSLERDERRQAEDTNGKRGRPRNRANKERDKWIYEMACNISKTWKQILAEFRIAAKQNGWPMIATENGLRDRADDYADDEGLPRPPRRYGN